MRMWFANYDHDTGMRNYCWVPTSSQQGTCPSKAVEERVAGLQDSQPPVTMVAPCPQERRSYCCPKNRLVILKSRLELHWAETGSRFLVEIQAQFKFRTRTKVWYQG